MKMEKKSDLKSGKKVGIKEGMKEGEKEGLKKGEKNAKTEIAKKLLNKGIGINIIIETTGLSEEEIKKIAN